MTIGRGMQSGADRILNAVMLKYQQDRQDKRQGMRNLNSAISSAGPNVYTGDILPTSGTIPQSSGTPYTGGAQALTVSNPGGGGGGAPFDPSGVEEQFPSFQTDPQAMMQGRNTALQRKSATTGAMKAARKMFGQVFKNQALIPKLELDLRNTMEETKLLESMLNQRRERSKFDTSVSPPSDAEIRMFQHKANMVNETKEKLKTAKGEVEELYGHLITKFGIDPSSMDEYSLQELGIKMDPDLLESMGFSQPGVPNPGQTRQFPAFGAQRGYGQFYDTGQPSAPPAPTQGAAPLAQPPLRPKAPPFMMRR